MSTPQITGIKRYWERVRAGEAKSPHEIRKQRQLLEDAEYAARHSKIASIQTELDRLEKHLALALVSQSLTTKTLLREDEIVSKAEPFNRVSGVYFLVKDSKIVYIGQSVNVHVRIADHGRQWGKDFDSVAYIACPQDMLDKLESIYIHAIRPPLNSITIGVPLKLDQLLTSFPQSISSEPPKAD